MRNNFKLIEIIISFLFIYISTFIPVYITKPFASGLRYDLNMPITWQIPTIIFISLLFKKIVVFRAFTFYLFLGLFVVPIFHQGGSLGYLLTPNFGYLLGIYPLIKIIDNLNKKKYISIINFFKTGILAISTMHFIGILYNFIQMIYYKQVNLFLYNIGSYSLGKIGYHFLMLIPLSFLIRPINFIKSRD